MPAGDFIFWSFYGDHKPRTTEAANMKDTDERSCAASGSQPVAWAVMYPNGKGVDTVFEYESDAREAACGDEEVVPLYRSTTLTDAEREAILKQKIELDQAGPDSYVVRSLTNRLDPVVGSVINKDAVEKLLSTSRQYKGKITVVVKPRP